MRVYSSILVSHSRGDAVGSVAEAKAGDSVAAEPLEDAVGELWVERKRVGVVGEL